MVYAVTELIKNTQPGSVGYDERTESPADTGGLSCDPRVEMASSTGRGRVLTGVSSWQTADEDEDCDHNEFHGHLRCLVRAFCGQGCQMLF